MIRCGLDSLLRDYGVKLGNDMVVDPTMSMPPDARNIVAKYGPQSHAIVDKLTGNNVLTIMPFMRSVQKTDPAFKGVTQTSFMNTTDNGWGVTDLKAKALKHSVGDTKGPVPLAMACELVLADNPAKKTRLVVYGGSNFLSNQFLQFPGNGDVGINSFSWASEEENKISIHPKQDEYRGVNLTTVSAGVMLYGSIFVIPLGTLLIGGIVWYRRRSL